MSDPDLNDSQTAIALEGLEQTLQGLIYDCTIAIVASILKLGEDRKDDSLRDLADEARTLLDAIQNQTLKRYYAASVGVKP